MSKDEENKVVVTIKLDPPLIEELDRQAKDENRSRSNMIETALWEWIAGKRKTKGS